MFFTFSFLKNLFFDTNYKHSEIFELIFGYLTFKINDILTNPILSTKKFKNSKVFMNKKTKKVKVITLN